MPEIWHWMAGQCSVIISLHPTTNPCAHSWYILEHPTPPSTGEWLVQAVFYYYRPGTWSPHPLLQVWPSKCQFAICHHILEISWDTCTEGSHSVSYVAYQPTWPTCSLSSHNQAAYIWSPLVKLCVAHWWPSQVDLMGYCHSQHGWWILLNGVCSFIMYISSLMSLGGWLMSEHRQPCANGP